MIKLASPNLGNRELNAIKSVFESNELVQGNEVVKFEEKIKDILKVKNVLAVSSGTAALHLSLLALGIGEGDEVIVPSLSFPATWNVVEIVGAKCVFVDIEKESFNIDTNKIEELITKKTKAIIVVHEFGSVANMGEIIKLKNKYNLKIIEDSACALGSKYNDDYVGTIGDAGCFSFHPRKNITTGEGGAVVTNDNEIAKIIKSLRNHGMENIDGKIDFVMPGLNYRMTNIQAAIGNVQLESLEKNYKKREEISKVYKKELGNICQLITPGVKEYETVNWQSYCIILSSNKVRESLKEFLLENLVESNYGAYSSDEISYYKNKYYLIDNDSNSNSRYVYIRGLCLPIHHNMCIDDAKYVSGLVKKFFMNKRLEIDF